MRPVYIFGTAITFYLIFGFFIGIYKPEGTTFRTRKTFSSGWFFLITSLFLWSADGNILLIGKGLLLGAVLCVPFCIYEKRWIDRRIEGTTRSERLFHESLGILVIILFLCFWKQIVRTIWPSLGFFFAWFSTQVYILIYVIRLERKLGSSILDDEK